MKLKELKRMLDKMSKEQLEQDLIVIANCRTQSGFGKARKARCNLYYDGEDDPSELKTMSELKDMYDSDEIAGMEVVVERGEFFIEL
jgi:ribosomal protein S24E